MRDYTYAVFIKGSSEGMNRFVCQVSASTLRDATILAQAELINQGLSDDGLKIVKID